MVYKPSLCSRKLRLYANASEGDRGGVGPGPKGYRTEKRDSTQATGEVTEMVGDAISADSSITDNVNTMKYLLKMQKCTIDYPTIPLLHRSPNGTATFNRPVLHHFQAVM